MTPATPAVLDNCLLWGGKNVFPISPLANDDQSYQLWAASKHPWRKWESRYLSLLCAGSSTTMVVRFFALAEESKVVTSKQTTWKAEHLGLICVLHGSLKCWCGRRIIFHLRPTCLRKIMTFLMAMQPKIRWGLCSLTAEGDLSMAFIIVVVFCMLLNCSGTKKRAVYLVSKSNLNENVSRLCQRNCWPKVKF